MSYYQNLKHPDWQRKRLELYQRDGFKCRLCGASDRQLHLHHMCYARDGDWRGVPDKFLITICVDCHNEISGLQEPKRKFYEPKVARVPLPNGRPNTTQTVADSNLDAFLLTVNGMGKNKAAKALDTYLASHRKYNLSLSSCKRVIALLAQSGRLIKRGDFYFSVNTANSVNTVSILPIGTPSIASVNTTPKGVDIIDGAIDVSCHGRLSIDRVWREVCP